MDRQVNMESEINRDSLSDYLRERYPTREQGSDMWPGMLEDLITKLHIYGFNTIGQIKQALDRAKEAFDRFEEDNLPSNLVGSQYFAEATVWLSMQLCYDDFPAFEKSAVDSLDPDKLAEYRKYILPEGN